MVAAGTLARMPVAPRIAFVALAVIAVAGGCDERGGDLEAYCATARGFREDNPAAAFALVDPTDPTATAAALRSAGERLRQWAEDAPSDIDQDVEALADGADALAQDFESGTTATVDEQAARTEALATSSAEVQRYTEEQCGVTLDPASTTTVP
jgi:hypothetical protein